MPWYVRWNSLFQQLREDEGRLFLRLMRDPVTVISKHDDPGEKAYLAKTFRLNQRGREQTASGGVSPFFGSSVLPGSGILSPIPTDGGSPKGRWRTFLSFAGLSTVSRVPSTTGMNVGRSMDTTSPGTKGQNRRVRFEPSHQRSLTSSTAGSPVLPRWSVSSLRSRVTRRG
jgi:hypothetical protein